MRAISIAAVAGVCALVCAAPAPAAAAGCRNADAIPGRASQSTVDHATLCLLNQQRAAAHLRPLTASRPLARAASRYAAYMVSTDHFAHVDMSGHNVVDRVLHTDPALRNRWIVIGENLGWGSFGLATPRAMVAGWMASPEHRANILCPAYRQIGVGVANGAPVPGAGSALTYATVFAKLSRR